MVSTGKYPSKEDRKLLSEESNYAEIPLDEDEEPSQSLSKNTSSSSRGGGWSAGGVILVAATILVVVGVVVAGKHGCPTKMTMMKKPLANPNAVVAANDYQLRGSSNDVADETKLETAGITSIVAQPADALKKMPCGKKKPGMTTVDDAKVLEIVNNARDAALHQLAQEAKQQVSEKKTAEDALITTVSSATTAAAPVEVEWASDGEKDDVAREDLDEEGAHAEEDEGTAEDEEDWITTEKRTAVDPIWTAPDNVEFQDEGKEDEKGYAPLTMTSYDDNDAKFEEEDEFGDDDSVMDSKVNYTPVDDDESVLVEVEDLEDENEFPSAEERWAEP